LRDFLLLAVFLALLRGAVVFFLVLDFDFGALLLVFFLAGIAAVYHFARMNGRIQWIFKPSKENQVMAFSVPPVSRW